MQDSYLFVSCYSSHSEITTEEERRQYKKQFDISLTEYKNLCAEMDDISDQINELSRELDTLHEESTKFQVGIKKTKLRTFLDINYNIFYMI